MRRKRESLLSCGLQSLYPDRIFAHIKVLKINVSLWGLNKSDTFFHCRTLRFNALVKTRSYSVKGPIIFLRSAKRGAGVSEVPLGG